MTDVYFSVLASRLILESCIPSAHTFSFQARMWAMVLVEPKESNLMFGTLSHFAGFEP